MREQRSRWVGAALALVFLAAGAPAMGLRVESSASRSPGSRSGSTRLATPHVLPAAVVDAEGCACSAWTVLPRRMRSGLAHRAVANRGKAPEKAPLRTADRGAGAALLGLASVPSTAPPRRS